jgi:FkbM family methyltransferase
MKLRRALAHTWVSRKLWRNPAAAFWFFWRGEEAGRDSGKGKFQYDQLPFVARLQDWNGVQEVVLEQEYAFAGSLYAGRRPIVVDVGANIGMFSLSIFSNWPAARVHAIEPSLATYQILDCNRAFNPGLDWHVYRAAAWHTDGEVSFDNKPFSTSSHVGASGSDVEQVPAVRLDTFLNQNVPEPVDLLKVDIEGAEDAVLQSASAILSKVAHLIVEIHAATGRREQTVSTLRSAFPYLYQVPGRRSSKPLVLATRTMQPLPEFAP